MKRTFVVDEDVFIFAQKGENNKGDLDITASTFVQNIFYFCHAIALDNTLEEKYSQKMSAIQKSGKLIGVNFLGLINSARHNPNKVRFIQSVPKKLECENSVKDDDRYLVRLSVAAEAILVTNDSPLKESILESCLTRRYNIQVMFPDEAIKYASPQDSAS